MDDRNAEGMAEWKEIREWGKNRASGGNLGRRGLGRQGLQARAEKAR